MAQLQTPLQELATRNVEMLKAGLPVDDWEFLRLFHIGTGQNGVDPPTDEQVAQSVKLTSTSGKSTRGNVTHRLHAVLDRLLYNGVWPAYKELRKIKFPDGQSFNSQQTFDFLGQNQWDGGGSQRTTDQMIQLASAAMKDPGALAAPVSAAVPAPSITGQHVTMATASSSEDDEESERRRASSPHEEQTEQEGDAEEAEEEEEDTTDPSKPSQPTPATPGHRHGRHTRGLSSLRDQAMIKIGSSEYEEYTIEEEAVQPNTRWPSSPSSSSTTRPIPADWGKAVRNKIERKMAETNMPAPQMLQARDALDRELQAYRDGRDRLGRLNQKKREKADKVANERWRNSSAPSTPAGNSFPDPNAAINDTADQAWLSQGADLSQRSQASQEPEPIETHDDSEDAMDLDVEAEIDVGLEQAAMEGELEYDGLEEFEPEGDDMDD